MPSEIDVCVRCHLVLLLNVFCRHRVVVSVLCFIDFAIVIVNFNYFCTALRVFN